MSEKFTEDDLKVFIAYMGALSKDMRRWELCVKSNVDVCSINDEDALLQVADGCRRIVMQLRRERGQMIGCVAK